MSTKPFKKGFDCGQLKEHLPDYLDKSLQDHVCEIVNAHLEECEDCRIFVKTVETTMILYKHCPGCDIPEEVRIDLRQHLRVSIEERSRKKEES